ncbi:cell division protein FtsL, partial [bacterium]|nr:cell division protein FtsL [bacterium]
KRTKKNYTGFFKNDKFIFIVGIIIIVWLIKLYIPIVSKKHNIQQKKESIAKEIEELNLTYTKLLNESKRLEEDKEYIEQIAREQLGLAKKDEIIYSIIYDNKESNN